ncbi:V-type ATP synthase subunit I [Candidatus Marsarchaeota archaeon]|nr:V-type ATP synthase subunit I [Candidatus Marsarchaeota archaeon]MCL5404340.1 V-type ATP synthase subunit I [Candidatus Marsarchaeota archaeon]
MLLKPAKMERERIIFPKDLQHEVVGALHDTGVMQIEYLPERALQLLAGGSLEDYKEISDYAQRFRSLEGMLDAYETEATFTFATLEDLMAKANQIDIDEKVVGIKSELGKLSDEMKEHESMLSMLKKMPRIKHDLRIFSSERIVSFLVFGRELEKFNAEVHSKVEDCVVIKGEYSTIISMKKDFEQSFGTYAKGLKLTVELIPKLEGTLAANEADEEKKIGELKGRIELLEADMRNISEVYYPIVSAIREQLDIEVERAEAAAKFGVSKSVIAIEGWIPEEDVDRLHKAIKTVTGGKFLMEKISTKELPPTKMENPVTTKLFEFFIKFYSLPKSNEIDPTLIFAVVFPIFFGFMIGDAGYGAVMLLGAFWLLRRLGQKKKNAKSHFPKAISNFVHTIVSDNGLKILAKSIIPGSIIAIALGVVFNEYFGFQLPYTALFNVETGLPTLLVLSGWIGVFMVSFGFVLGFLNKLAIGNKKLAAGRIGWLMAAWGIVIFGLAVLHREPLGLSNAYAVLSYFLLIGGVAVFLVAEGFESLMELPSLISHILSYTRLIGILLASVILAQVIDFIFLHAIKHSIVLAIVGIVILLLGQLFNIAIALFEPGIQGARLIYVEFFSKFFSGNGNEFRPFTSRRRHTKSGIEL